MLMYICKKLWNKILIKLKLKLFGLNDVKLSLYVLTSLFSNILNLDISST